LPTKLYRPVGLFELELIWDSGMKGFPARLAHQPIFYPVLSLDYARQIARDWNTSDRNSGYSGFVTAFDVDSCFLAQYEIHTVGSSSHREYWIPAEDLPRFNSALAGKIEVLESYFGEKFAAPESESFRRFLQEMNVLLPKRGQHAPS
jgi:hypothetical protein